MSSPATTNIFQTEWDNFKAAAASDVAKVEAVVASFAPVVIADFNAFFTKYAPVAAASIIKLMGEEFAALAGAEKQSQVVTDLIQAAETDGHIFADALRTYALTTAQDAYTKLAAIATGG